MNLSQSKMEALKLNKFWTIFMMSLFLILTFSSNQADGKRRRPPRDCWQPKNAGLCKGFFPRWYYNRKMSRCDEFTYGGCGGNGNNFKSLEECEMKCHKIMAWGV